MAAHPKTGLGGQLYGGDGLGGETFTATCEAHGFCGGGFDTDCVEGKLQDFGQTGAHGLAVGFHLGALADQGDIDVN